MLRDEGVGTGPLETPPPRDLAKSRLPRPFLKWVGGKGQILSELLDRVERIPYPRRYFEPFVGGGALFFELARRSKLQPGALISDANPNLIDAYLGVRDDVDGVVRELAAHAERHSASYYYEMRATVPECTTSRAARIIYLNKTCFNGLYRENSRGEFNVPIGDYTNPNICDEKNLRATSMALSSVHITVGGFEESIAATDAGDIVYCDPPYVPLSVTSSFTGYAKKGFALDDQIRLAEAARWLADRGVYVIISNSDTAFVHQAYAGFRIERVLAARAVNSRGDRRGRIPELVITNF